MAQLLAYNVDVAIAIGASLSGAVDLGEGRLAAIQLPSDWTAADLTFQASYDGTTFGDVYDDEDAELVVQAAASRYVVLPIASFLGMRHIKIRSGTTGAPVAQLTTVKTLRCRVIG